MIVVAPNVPEPETAAVAGSPKMMLPISFWELAVVLQSSNSERNAEVLALLVTFTAPESQSVVAPNLTRRVKPALVTFCVQVPPRCTRRHLVVLIVFAGTV